MGVLDQAAYLYRLGLHREPFGNVVEPDLFFVGPSHRGVLEKLYYAIQQGRGLVVVHGDVGTGKTSVLRQWMSDVDDETIEAIYLSLRHPEIHDANIHRYLARKMGVMYPSAEHEVLLRQIFRRIHYLHTWGRKLVVLCDDVQRATPAMARLLHDLTSLQTRDQRIVTVVLCGSVAPDTLFLEHADIRRDLGFQIHLPRMGVDECREYICYRSAQAGNPALFSSEVVALIVEATQGCARRLNTMADHLLMESGVQQCEPNVALAKKVAQQLQRVWRDDGGGHQQSIHGEETAKITSTTPPRRAPRKQAPVFTQKIPTLPKEDPGLSLKKVGLDVDALAAQVADEPLSLFPLDDS